jgi:hypothetical protein
MEDISRLTSHNKYYECDNRSPLLNLACVKGLHHIEIGFRRSRVALINDCCHGNGNEIDPIFYTFVIHNEKTYKEREFPECCDTVELVE